MWDPERPWRQQGSFVQAVPPPAAHPGDAPLVCLSFNRLWLPPVLGALLQLMQPSSWQVADEAARSAVLLDATELIERVGTAGECPMPEAWRFTADCLLQVSADGGVTYTTVPGWAAFAAACFTGPAGRPGDTGSTGLTGATGLTGPPGTFTPADPTNPRGDTTAQRACSIAGYLARQLIQTSVSKVIADIGTGATIAAIAGDIIATIAGAGVLTPVIAAATYELYNAIQSGTLSHYTDARDSSQFWADVTCSINSAIAGTGFVTAGNFAAVLGALATTPYVHTDVVSTVHDYVQALGVDAIREIQAVGALAVVDCSGCGEWCFRWDFTAAEAPWAITPGQVGTYTAGTGFVGVSDVGRLEVDLWHSGWGAPRTIDDVLIEHNDNAADTSGISFIRLYLAADYSSHVDVGWAPAGTGVQVTTVHVGQAGVYALWVRANVQPDSGRHLTVTAVRFRGPGAGVNPFGTNNCPP